MRALTLTQPWATLVAIGAKNVETRSWSTKFRGRLAIHAAKGYPKDCQKLAATGAFRWALLHAGYGDTRELPTGVIIATADVIEVLPTEQIVVSSVEREFGDYSAGRFAWWLHDVRRTVQPIACRGMLGLWTVPAELTIWEEVCAPTD